MTHEDSNAAIMDLHVRILALRLEKFGLTIPGIPTGGTDPVALIFRESSANPFIPGESDPMDENAIARTGEIEAENDGLKAEIISQEEVFKTRGGVSRARFIQSLFITDELDWDILLFCFAYAMDPRFRGMFAYVSQDPRMDFPCLELFHRVLADSLGERQELTSRCRDESPLLRGRLLRFAGDRESAPDPMRQPILIDEHIAHYLMGGLELDSGCRDLLSKNRFRHKEQPFLDDWENLNRVIKEGMTVAYAQLFHFRGLPNSEPMEAALEFARYSQLNVLRLDTRGLLQQPQEHILEIVDRTARECALRGAVLLIEDMELFRNQSGDLNAHGMRLLQEIESYFLPSIMTSRVSLQIDFPDDIAANYHEIRVEPLAYESRLELWKIYLADLNIQENLSIELVASRFQFSAGAIREAAHMARNHALRARGPDAEILEVDLLAGCRARSGQQLGEVAVKVESKFGWEDLVLPPGPMKILREACLHLKHGERVYEDWGYGNTSTAKRGLHLLFAGPPGTGKTMAAGVMAREMGLEMYRIDLAMMVSKYIGETEKNLARVFAAAESANAVLFFDEADALFGKRGEISNSNDRYANIEVGYLLQKMEDYRGMTILASNLAENMDAAFLRRLHFTIEFSLPDATQRRRLWSIAIPEKAPVADDLDLDYLAEHLNLSGGNIKNIARQAGFYAAEDSPNGEAGIRMAHLVKATKREYEKEGKSLLIANLGPYKSLLGE